MTGGPHLTHTLDYNEFLDYQMIIKFLIFYNIQIMSETSSVCLKYEPLCRLDNIGTSITMLNHKSLKKL